MNMEVEELDEHDGQMAESDAISLDVKLAFSRLTSLIYTLKYNIGEEAADYQLLRIRNDIAKVLKSRRNREFFKEEVEIKKKDEIEFVEFHPLGEFDTANSSLLKSKGAHNFPPQNKDSEIEYHLQQNNGTSSFFRSKNDELSSTFSSFRPVIKKTIDLEKCVELEIVDEKNRLEKNGTADESDSDEQDEKIDESIRKKSISTKKKMKNLKEPQTKRKSLRNRLKPSVEDNNKQSNTEVKAAVNNAELEPSSPKKPQPLMKVKNKKTNDTSKNNSKKSKCAMNSKKSDELDQEKNITSQKSGNGLGKDEDGPFSEILEDESSFILPMPSLTTDDLLDSIKTNVIKGRYTPPTSMFDNVYGNKSHSSSENTSFTDDTGVKNNHVVKRMCKINKKPKAKQSDKSPKHMMKSDETINEILRAAKAKTNTTPSIIKEVFSQEKADDLVNLSDLSDAEDA